ncbi:MAG: hypothetical protein K2K12_00745, partial [Clostridia bacterium]|nr:hypothetical protein [Clostridia bacterium]
FFALFSWARRCVYEPVAYEERSEKLQLEPKDAEEATKIIKELYSEYKQETKHKLDKLIEEVNKKHDDIVACIMKYQDKYKAAKSKTGQNEVVEMVRAELFDRYKIDGRTNRCFTPMFIRLKLEGGSFVN